MTRTLRNRLILFGLAICVIAVAIGWVAYVSWDETEKLRDRFGTEQLRSFAIADHIQSTILQLNDRLTRFELQDSKNALNDFSKGTTELNAWLNEQKQQLSSKHELDVLNQIHGAYQVYLNAATNGDFENLSSDQKKLRRLQRTSDASLTLIELGRQLADAHREVLQQFLIASQKSLTTLQHLRAALLGLLTLSFVWLFLTIYREMIAPLQRKLVESHAIIERQEKLASLGVLAAGVAHEIRNPLTAIKARLFTQQKSLTKGSAAYEDSLVISTEITRLDQIVKDVLQFARPAEPRLQQVRAEPILREVQQLLASEYEPLGIRLVIDWSSAVAFSADPQQIKQVLINLIRNAAESIGHNGNITLGARSARARLSGQARPVIILEVRDTGKGIPADVQKRLFDPFFSTKDGGTGLGLSIAARIIQKHGGALEFQTHPNRGTTFGIVLPTLES